MIASCRKFVAPFLVLALALAMAPMANASGISSAMTMQKTMPMPCDQHMPMRGGQMPCSDYCGCCLGMLGCVAPVALPELAALPVEFRFEGVAWNRERDPGDSSTHPPYRPPIV